MVANRCLPLALALLFSLTLSNSALGYIDGGTGSLLLQAAISGLLGAVFVFRSFFSGLFGKGRNVQTEPSEDADELKAA